MRSSNHIVFICASMAHVHCVHSLRTWIPTARTAQKKLVHSVQSVKLLVRETKHCLLMEIELVCI